MQPLWLWVHLSPTVNCGRGNNASPVWVPVFLFSYCVSQDHLSPLQRYMKKHVRMQALKMLWLMCKTKVILNYMDFEEVKTQQKQCMWGPGDTGSSCVRDKVEETKDQESHFTVWPKQTMIVAYTVNWLQHLENNTDRGFVLLELVWNLGLLCILLGCCPQMGSGAACEAEDPEAAARSYKVEVEVEMCHSQWWEDRESLRANQRAGRGHGGGGKGWILAASKCTRSDFLFPRLPHPFSFPSIHQQYVHRDT